MLATVEENPADDKGFGRCGHFFMVHYKEKEGIKKRKKKKYKPKLGQYQLEAGIKGFGK